MNENEVNEIIDFINKKYNESIPGLLKPIVSTQTKKIETIQLEDLPISFRNCTIEELIRILQKAHREGRLAF